MAKLREHIKRLAFKVLRSDTVRATFSGYQWYRRLHGGRWERWWISICASKLWLPVDEHVPDNHREPCSEGPRIEREDYEFIVY